MAVQLTDGTNNVPVDATSKGLTVQVPKVLSQTGHMGMAALRDAGTVTGTPNAQHADITNNNRLRVSLDTPLFQDQFNYTAQNTTSWKITTTTMTATFANAGMTLNAGASVATSVDAVAQTYRSFPLFTAGELVFDSRHYLTAVPQVNNAVYFGIGTPGTTAAPTDGMYFQFDATGVLRGVINWNGTTATTGALTAPSINVSHDWVIVIDDGIVEFWIDGVLQGSINPTSLGAGAGTPGLNSSGYAFYQIYNGGSAPGTAQKIVVQNLQVTLFGINSSKPWAHIKAGEGLAGYQGQNGGTLGTSAGNMGNSAAIPTSAAGSNTAALTTGLGGVVQINAAATAATDFILTSYQNPAGSVNQTPRNLYITGVRISMTNQGAAVATTPTTALLSLAYGHTAVSLATTESATTKAPRRVPLGFQSWVVGALAGAAATPGDIIVQFVTPLLVQPGEFIASVLKFAVGTATASQTLLGTVTFDSYWE
jgi:hypothetical protein